LASFGAVDSVAAPGNLGWARPGKDGRVDAAPFRLPVGDFYLTNPIARASSLMAELSALAAGRLGLRAAE